MTRARCKPPLAPRRTARSLAPDVAATALALAPASSAAQQTPTLAWSFVEGLSVYVDGGHTFDGPADTTRTLEVDDQRCTVLPFSVQLVSNDDPFVPVQGLSVAIGADVRVYDAESGEGGIGSGELREVTDGKACALL